MITLADLTSRRAPIAHARAQLDTQAMLLQRYWSRRADVVFWAVWLTGAAAFCTLALWSAHRYALPLDIRLTQWVQGLDRYPRAGRVFGIVNDFGDYQFIAAVLLMSFGWLLLRGLRFEALMLAGAGALRYVQLGVRDVVHRPFDAGRPPWANAAFPYLRRWPGPDGFPSGHVFGEIAVYGLIFAYAGRVIPVRPVAWLVRAFCVFEIALGGPARVYTGAHWPSDVAGAALLALLYVGLAWRIDRAVLHIREVTAERDLASQAGLSGERRSRAGVAAESGVPVATPELARTR
jgi:undecaprenyl-diphosphatase